MPSVGDAARVSFLRWLVFLVANVYPTYTYGDEPSRFVDGAEAAQSFRGYVDAYAKSSIRGSNPSRARRGFSASGSRRSTFIFAS